ncbi:MAG: prepilin-type N-terminal cleavage/methylation domain-containing protein [Deltaproteobacteria bacterium]|nr:prepilin-type N-terminal cleavage/methylation domain-containing protein [Deltaproteobacteria bacterium]
MRGTHGAKSRSKRAGYTLIEVMMAVAIMTVGSVGVLSLHQATTNGNRGAREMSTATDLVRLYLERVRRDALLWTEAGNVTSTELLVNVPTAAAFTGDWFIPTPGIGESHFDYAGRDTMATDEMYFCTNMRASWIIAQEAIRVDTRVWWHRTASNTARTAFTCASAPTAITAELAAAAPRIRSVAGSTVVRWQRPN